MSINFTLINDLPISDINSDIKLDYITLHRFSISLSSDLDFIISMEIENNYQHFKKEDVSKSFINTIKSQLDIDSYHEENGSEYKFIISSRN